MGQRQALLGVAAGFGLAQEGSPLNTRCTTPGEPRPESGCIIDYSISYKLYCIFYLYLLLIHFHAEVSLFS